MSAEFSDPIKQQVLARVADALAGGTIVLYDGTRPAKGADPGASNELGRATFQTPAAVVSPSSIGVFPVSGTGTQVGNPTWARLLDSQGGFILDEDAGAVGSGKPIEVSYGIHVQMDIGSRFDVQLLTFGQAGPITASIAALLASATGVFAGTNQPVRWLGGPPSTVTVNQSGVYSIASFATPPGVIFTIAPGSAKSAAQLASAGVTLSSLGLFSASSAATVTSYAGIIVRADDQQGHFADCDPFTLQVDPAAQASPAWDESALSSASLQFMAGTASSKYLPTYIVNWDPTKYVIQLANATDTFPLSESDLLPMGISCELDGTLSYDGLGPIASSSNIAFKINPIQQDVTQRFAGRSKIRSFDFNSDAQFRFANRADGNNFGDPYGTSPTYMASGNVGPMYPVLDTAVKASGVSSARFSTPPISDIIQYRTFTTVMGTGDGANKTFSITIGATAQVPIVPRVYGGTLTVTATIGGQTVTARDSTALPTNNGRENIIEVAAGVTSGTVAYGVNTSVNAAVSVTFTNPPDNGTPVTISYCHTTRSMGNWFANFADDHSIRPGAGQEYFIQWRERFDTNRLLYSGIKICLDTLSDPDTCTFNSTSTCLTSCTVGEICVQQIYPRPFAEAYECCPGTHFQGLPGHGAHVQSGYNNTTGEYSGTVNLAPVIGGEIYRQQGRPAPFCLQSQQTQNPPFSNTGCFLLYPNEWMTFMIGVKLGAFVPSGTSIPTGCFSNSHIRVWQARDPAVVGQGAASQLQPIIDIVADVASELRGKFWITSRDLPPAVLPANQWLDEVIFSWNPIASPS